MIANPPPGSAAERAPFAVALDTADLAAACRIAARVAGQVTTLKLGLQLFAAEGPAALEKLRADAPGVDIFLDLKLHDIPTTVAKAAGALARLAPRILTVHALGGEAMIAGAVQAIPDAEIAAVTILTSHTATDLERVGISGTDAAGDATAAVVRLSKLAVSAGARALVCSPREVATVRRAVGPGIRLITPGIRPAGAADDDQARVATPEQALANGADLLVIGRPITAASDPAQAAAVIATGLTAGRASVAP